MNNNSPLLSLRKDRKSKQSIFLLVASTLRMFRRKNNVFDVDTNPEFGSPIKKLITPIIHFEKTSDDNLGYSPKKENNSPTLRYQNQSELTVSFEITEC